MPRRPPGRPRKPPRIRKIAPTGGPIRFQETARERPFAPTESREALRRLTRQQLVTLARSEGLTGLSRLRKVDLVRALSVDREHASAGTPSAPSPGILDWGHVPLPGGYKEDRLVLLTIDPYWVHAYWELAAHSAPEHPEGITEERGKVRPVLRVYDVTYIDFDGTNAHGFFDIEITPQARKWYINLWSPTNSLCAELGTIQPDGTFSPWIRSNIVHTPPAWASPHTEERWMRVSWNQGQAVREDFGSLSVREPGRQDRREMDLPGGSASSEEFSSPAPSPSESAQSAPQPGEAPEGVPLGEGRSEALLRQGESMLAEAYRRFLGEIRRGRSLGTSGPVPQAPAPPPAEEAFEGPDLDLSSFGWIKGSEGSTPDPTRGSRDA